MNTEQQKNIWTGTSTFVPNTGMTAWGYYDSDPAFASKADLMAKWVAGKLGYPQYDVELDSGSLYTAFEEGVSLYARELYNYQLIDNYYSYLGTPSSSFNPNQLAVPSLGNIVRIAQTYGQEANLGGHMTHYTGSIQLIPNKQNYNMTEWANASASLAQGDTIEIRRIFHNKIPASVRAGYYGAGGSANLGIISEFGFGGIGVNTTQMNLMPMSLTVLQSQQIEMFDEIRRSGFQFELTNNNLRLMPVPTESVKLYFEYIKESERSNGSITLPNGSITNPSEVPYGNITYSTINQPGREWIAQYTLALAMDKLAFIRGLFNNTVPIAGDTTQLNTPDLISRSTALKEGLISQIRETFQATSRRAQLEQKQAEAEYAKQTLTNVPMGIWIG